MISSFYQLVFSIIALSCATLLPVCYVKLTQYVFLAKHEHEPESNTWKPPKTRKKFYFFLLLLVASSVLMVFSLTKLPSSSGQLLHQEWAKVLMKFGLVIPMLALFIGVFFQLYERLNFSSSEPKTIYMSGWIYSRPAAAWGKFLIASALGLFVLAQAPVWVLSFIAELWFG